MVVLKPKLNYPIQNLIEIIKKIDMKSISNNKTEFVDLGRINIWWRR